MLEILLEKKQSIFKFEMGTAHTMKKEFR